MSTRLAARGHRTDVLCRLPVVISDNVGLASKLTRADVHVAVPLGPDRAPLIQATAAMLDDDARRESLGHRGHQFAIENYDTPAAQTRINHLLGVVRLSRLRL